MENLEKYRDLPVYFWNKITIKDKALFYEHLSNMVDWWVSVIKALEWFLEKTQNPLLAREIANLLVFIESWDPFSTAMKKLPYIFSNKEVAIVEAWESSWTMQKSFDSLSKQLRTQEELKQKATQSLTYPIIIMCVLIIAVIVIMTYVIPKIKPLFETAWIELPFATKTLIGTSEFFLNNFFLIIFGIIATILGLKIFSKTDSGKKYFDTLYLKMPLVWDVYRNYIIAQVSSNLGLLIQAGIPIIKTLKLSWDSSNNEIYKQAIYMVADSVSQWKKLTGSIEEVDPEHRYFPADLIQMFEAWEKTSTLNKVCDKLSNQYTREVEHSINVLVKWIEPLAIVIAWIFVLWFAFAIFSAVMMITETVA